VKRRILVALGVIVLAGGAFGLYWFQPWKLFTTNEVNDSVPVVATGQPAATDTAETPAGNRLLAQGTFITHEHETTGRVQLVELPGGRRQLVLLDLDTSDGPDLRVWLTDQPVIEGTTGWRVFDDGSYVELARLRGNKGNQVYDIPSNVDTSQFRSVSIWCKRFAVSFGAAELSPA
jgi:hypothetical protein